MVSTDGMVRLLRGLAPCLACCCGVLAPLAVGGSSWLATQERFTNPAYANGSSRVHYLYKKTMSGLFVLCQTDVGADVFSCSSIDYFSQGAYTPDPQDATLAIPYTAVRACPFFLTGLALLVVAEAVCARGHCRRGGTRVYTFIAGVTFIMQGLLMMMGCVTYIATLKGEVWQKLQPRSTYTPAPFTYSYGIHFAMMVTAFTTAELAGFCSIMLFIYWHKRDWERSLKNTPCDTPTSHPSCPSSLFLPYSSPTTPHSLYTQAMPSTGLLSCPGHAIQSSHRSPFPSCPCSSLLRTSGPPSVTCRHSTTRSAASSHAPNKRDVLAGRDGVQLGDNTGIVAVSEAGLQKRRSLDATQSEEQTLCRLGHSQSELCLQHIRRTSVGPIQIIGTEIKENEDSDYANFSLISEMSSGKYESRYEMVGFKPNCDTISFANDLAEHKKINNDLTDATSSDTSTEENASKSNADDSDKTNVFLRPSMFSTNGCGCTNETLGTDHLCVTDRSNHSQLSDERVNVSGLSSVSASRDSHCPDSSCRHGAIESCNATTSRPSFVIAAPLPRNGRVCRSCEGPRCYLQPACCCCVHCYQNALLWPPLAGSVSLDIPSPGSSKQTHLNSNEGASQAKNVVIKAS